MSRTRAERSREEVWEQTVAKIQATGQIVEKLKAQSHEQLQRSRALRQRAQALRQQWAELQRQQFSSP